MEDGEGGVLRSTVGCRGTGHHVLDTTSAVLENPSGTERQVEGVAYLASFFLSPLRWEKCDFKAPNELFGAKNRREPVGISISKNP